VNALDHVFRHAGGCLVDHPDLPLPSLGLPWRWIATVWPEPATLDGWAALEWQPGDRGWQLPATLMVGDVVEFGTCGLDDDGRPIRGTACRWYGWLHHVAELAAVVVGPYPDAARATRAAQPVVDELRCAQLVSPAQMLANAEDRPAPWRLRGP
jgi:hypothetical protein